MTHMKCVIAMLALVAMVTACVATTNEDDNGAGDPRLGKRSVNQARGRASGGGPNVRRVNTYGGRVVPSIAYFVCQREGSPCTSARTCCRSPTASTCCVGGRCVFRQDPWSRAPSNFRCLQPSSA